MEKTHHELYSGALAQLEQGKDLGAGKIWVCDICGHTHIGDEAPENCPVCKAGRKQFSEVN